MKLTEVAKIDYAARMKPPYKWAVFAENENGRKKAIIEKGQGSWVTAMWAAQDWTKLIAFEQFLDVMSKEPLLASLFLRLKIN